MADLDMLVGLCSSYRVTINDGGSRREIHCLATDEGSVRQRMEEMGYTMTGIERVPTREFQKDPLYGRAEMWALGHEKVGVAQVDVYPTSGYFDSRMR